MYAIIRELVLVVGSKAFTININTNGHDLAAQKNYPIKVTNNNTLKHNTDPIRLVFDVTNCHPEYVLDMVLSRKGNDHAMIRSLYMNAEALWLNEQQVCAASAEYILAHKGKCLGIPCFACPFGYLTDSENRGCWESGYRTEDTPPEEEDSTTAHYAQVYASFILIEK